MDKIDYAFNMNFMGPPKGMKKVLKEAVSRLMHYPDHSHGRLRDAVSSSMDIDGAGVTFGAGATDIIFSLPHVFQKGAVLIPQPTFWEYEVSNARFAGTIINTWDLQEKDDFRMSFASFDERLDRTEVVYLCNPNNPTSKEYPAEDLRRHIEEHPEVDFVVDETYLLFDEGYDEKTLTRMAVDTDNVYVVVSFSKFFAVPGLRLGMLVSHPDNIERYKEGHTPYMTSPLAPPVLEHILEDKDFIARSRKAYGKRRKAVVKEASKLLDPDGFKVIEPEAPFVLIKLLKGAVAQRITALMERKGLMIRDCTDIKGLGPEWIRAAIRGRKEMVLLFEELNANL